MFPKWAKRRWVRFLNSLGDDLYDDEGNLIPYEPSEESQWIVAAATAKYASIEDPQERAAAIHAEAFRIAGL
jgi:hypothetical protein